MTDQLQIWTDGALGRIVLNRPEAINALSLEMIDGIVAALQAWRDDAAIGAVLIGGNGQKGFCAGGDVRAARADVVEGRAELADAYFAAEYRMNAIIAGYRKPLVALSHGVVMGGGIGIAGHCRFRFTQPEARFAMPEAAIGFFSDVGVNAILAQAPLGRALLFLMSGASVGAADALELGLADAVVSAEQAGRLREELAAAAASRDPAEAIVRIMEAHTITAGETRFCTLANLLPTGAPATAAEFIERVDNIPALAELSALLAARSPTALTAIFHSHLAARQLMSIEATLAMDSRVARMMVRAPDFAEGVRAVLVDKDQKPHWSPRTLGEVATGTLLEAIESC